MLRTKVIFSLHSALKPLRFSKPRTPRLEPIKCENLVSKVWVFRFSLHRYTGAEAAARLPSFMAPLNKTGGGGNDGGRRSSLGAGAAGVGAGGAGSSGSSGGFGNFGGGFGGAGSPAAHPTTAPRARPPRWGSAR
jgi:hypothetical protein